MKPNNCDALAPLLLDWYAIHWRALPWRENPTPYRVWISEIMLQQTRIEAVLPYYARFMAALPDIAALAAVPEDTLLKLWEGLGYYSRARNLKKAAECIMQDYGGVMPADYDALLGLPGIGAYTAGAIASIAFNIPVPAVDGNVMRVLARLTGDGTDVLSTAGKKRFTDLAWELVDERQPGRFNQALMELGERICLPNTTPRCDECPWRLHCVAWERGLTDSLPVRTKKKPRRIERRRVALVRLEGEPPRILLRKRPDSGLLAGLWEFPNGLEAEEFLPEAWTAFVDENAALPTSKHIFTHIEWHMSATLYRLPADTALPDGYVAVTFEEQTASYALPSAFRAYTSLLGPILKGEDSTWTKEKII